MKRVALLLLVATATANAQPTEPERLFNAGQKAYDEKRYDEALAAWERSYALSQLPALLFNIAQAYRLRALPGDCTKASDTYQRFLTLDRTSPQRAKAQTFVGELAPCVAAEGKSQPAVQPQAQPATQTVENKPPVVPERGKGMRIASYAAGGAGIAFVVTGVYFGNKARSLGEEVSDACAGGCAWETVADKDAEGKSAARKQWLFYGLGGVGLATAGVLYFLDTRAERGPRVSVAPRGDGAMVTWQRSW
jgi:hypothetical protein